MRVTAVVVCIAIFVGGLLISSLTKFPEVVTASIELFNSVESEDTGRLSSGFDTFRQNVLIGLEGLWSILFAGGLTALAYFLKGVQLVSSIVEAKLLKPKDNSGGVSVSQQELAFEQILIDAAYEGDDESLAFAANKLCQRKWCQVTKLPGA